MYQTVRTASGIGAGNGPFISYHDAFVGIAGWAGFLPGADRIAIDTHPYLCFGPQNNNPMTTWAQQPCANWAAEFNKSMTQFGFSMAGEWSLAVTDCGTFVNGVGNGARYDGTYLNSPVIGSCAPWLNYQTWSADLKTQTQQLALQSMDALQVSTFAFYKESYIKSLAELVLLDVEDWSCCGWEHRVPVLVVSTGYPEWMDSY